MNPRKRRLRKTLHTAEQRHFCALMAKARLDADLTQVELAGKLGKPQSFVAKYEIGERRLDVIEFLAVSQALGADPIRLLKALLRGGTL